MAIYWTGWTNLMTEGDYGDGEYTTVTFDTLGTSVRGHLQAFEGPTHYGIEVQRLVDGVPTGTVLRVGCLASDFVDGSKTLIYNTQEPDTTFRARAWASDYDYIVTV